jgi:hypothetical protein
LRIDGLGDFEKVEGFYGFAFLESSLRTKENGLRAPGRVHQVGIDRTGADGVEPGG